MKNAKFFYMQTGNQVHKDISASLAEWLRLPTSHHFPFTAVGSNPTWKVAI
jgi:hypothetical protein